jgi:hypothetical protein
VEEASLTLPKGQLTHVLRHILFAGDQSIQPLAKLEGINKLTT